MRHVVLGVIRDQDRVVVAKRPDQVDQGGLWEFPGGQVERGETPAQALVRELQEELGITAICFRPWMQVNDPKRLLLLDVWQVDQWSGQLTGNEGQPVVWVSPDQLGQYSFPKANRPIIQACRLPDRYLVTPVFDGSRANFLKRFERALCFGIKLVQFRQPHLPIEIYRDLAKAMIALAHEAKAKILLNGDEAIARQLQADGVHWSSRLLMSQDQPVIDDGFVYAASCHNRLQLQHAAKLACHFAVLGSLRPTQSHPGGPTLGWGQFADAVKEARLPVFAIGGLSGADIERVRQYGGQGVSGIRAWW